PSIAVDKSVAERTDRAAAVKASFSWDDVGSWDAFCKYFTENADSTVEIASKNNFVYSDIPVALCGVDDLTVVIRNGMALVLKKGSAGQMRDVVKAMKEKQRPHG
ncbi:MAG: mannose-1-phosphate guanylyltransferase, partial [Treponema sp.]|nr:mannose-1-phosphate guanylyltransferase [Treponema sp.]